MACGCRSRRGHARQRAGDAVAAVERQFGGGRRYDPPLAAAVVGVLDHLASVLSGRGFGGANKVEVDRADALWLNVQRRVTARLLLAALSYCPECGTHGQRTSVGGL